MHVEMPYDIEWPLVETLARRRLSAAEAARIMGVSVPTADTLLHHLESIGVGWQVPVEPPRRRSVHLPDWEITPAGRALMADRARPGRRRARAGHLRTVWAA